MKEQLGKITINKKSIVSLCVNALKMYDNRLIHHGERVAYIALKIAESLYSPEEIDIKSLVTLAVFHDVGAYRTEEIDRMIEFETNDVSGHSIYGYLFIKYFTPLSEMSEVILHHHSSNEIYNTIDFKYKNYSNLIHLADRIDIAMLSNIPKEDLINILRNPVFCQEQVDTFEYILNSTSLYEELTTLKFKDLFLKEVMKLPITLDESKEYLKMLIHTIDFKSEHTVVHSINTVIISKFISNKLNLSEKDTRIINLAAFLHDIGKIAIPISILEYPGPLSKEDMDIMKQHVLFTEDIIKDVLHEDIVKIAIRHHEKLNGTGYPYGLKESDLGLGDRIVAVADLLSALISKRSYKEEFNKDKTVTILKDMVHKNFIDPHITSIVTSNYDELISMIAETNAPIISIYNQLVNEYETLINNQN